MPWSVALMGLALVLTTACSPESSRYGFEVLSVDARPGREQLRANLRQRLRLSGEAQHALSNGVPVVIDVLVQLREENSGKLVSESTQQHEIRFLPLSEHFRLTTSGEASPRTYPRLRHVLAALSDIDVVLETGALQPGSYRLRARVRLDRTSLPAPMQLPALLIGNWRHDSRWSEWPFEISA